MPEIAIVEQDPLVRIDIERTLRTHGYAVGGSFADGESLLAALNELDCELLLLDTSAMAEARATGLIARAFAERGMYTVLISAIASDVAFKDLEAAAPLGIIMKPFAERELLGTLDVAANRADMARKLIKSELRYRSLFDAGLAPRCVASRGGEILEANASFLRLFGVPGQQSKPLHSLFPGPSYWEEILASLDKGAPVLGRELPMVGPGGQALTVLASFSIFADVHREERLVSCEFFDISESRRLREELYQAQKMEAMGRLAGGVAHDFNNILTAIMGHAEMLRLDLSKDHPSYGDVEGIRGTAERASRLTKQLLGFSRKQAYAPRTLDLGGLLKESAGLLRKLAGDKVLFSLSVPPAPLYVVADPTQVEQVCINLVVNARDAVEEAKNPRISLIAEERRIGGSRYAALEIGDNGKGIPESLREKIFEPFFTTKPAGKGTGLGLAIVSAVARQVGGDIEVESKENQGTLMRLLIPIAADEAGKGQPPAGGSKDNTFPALALPPLDSEILVVEDDEYLLGFLSHVLESSGAKAFAARNAGEALIAAEEGNFSAALIDVSLPGLDGLSLYKRLAANDGLPCLFMSGGNPDSFSLPSRAGYIEKPFTPEALIKSLAHVLAGYQESIKE
ncbi:MAG: ATP-binding protein [Spirochaetota bacterium]